MKLGWLWLSILNTTASPSPISMTPAFSPGPWITQGALVGSVRRWIFEDLYEQCSFHIAEKMPSSVKLGLRPISFSRRAYSSGLRPCSAMSSGVMAGSLDFTGKALDSHPSPIWKEGSHATSSMIHKTSAPQRLFGKRNPLGLRPPHIFGGALELSQDLGEDRLRLGLPAGFVEQKAVAHARFGAGIIGRDRLVFGQRVLGPAAVFQRAGVEQMPLGRLIVRPTCAQIVERGDRLLRMAETELGARLAERIDRIVAQRQ